MGEYIEGGGYEVDGVKFGLWMPTITAQALQAEEDQTKEEGETNEARI
jgi:hypothetical protein